MLGSTILGFHTRFHCKNFIETVDRYLEARIEHEHSTISFQRRRRRWSRATRSRSSGPTRGTSAPPGRRSRSAGASVFERLALPADTCIAVGVDRFDYTKGILERLHAVERLLEKYPEWIGRFSLRAGRGADAQLARGVPAVPGAHRSASPSASTSASAAPGYLPVHLLAQHHEHDAVNELYRAADVCVVTSLHDGMNLVCKEFVAARDDEQGVLILSRFAGAAREMPEALIVNPYHVEETADALHRAATMPPAEQRERMASLRMTVREFNVYRWAGRMLADAGRSRLRERIEARVRSATGSADMRHLFTSDGEDRDRATSSRLSHPRFEALSSRGAESPRVVS